MPAGGPGGIGMPMGAPAKPKVFPYNKEVIKGDKLKGFTWKRVILDKHGMGWEKGDPEGKGTQNIIKDNMK
jgi:hypothetical protein